MISKLPINTEGITPIAAMSILGALSVALFYCGDIKSTDKFMDVRTRVTYLCEI